MRRVSDLRGEGMNAGFIRELNERLKTLEEAINRMDGTSPRKVPLQMNGQSLVEVGHIVVRAPAILTRANTTELVPSEDDTADVDGLAEVVIPEIYKTLNALLHHVSALQAALASLGLVQVR